MLDRTSDGQLYFLNGKPNIAGVRRQQLERHAVRLGPGDLNGNSLTDLVATDTSGNAWLYPGTGTGNSVPRLIGGGWNATPGSSPARAA